MLKYWKQAWEEKFVYTSRTTRAGYWSFFLLYFVVVSVISYIIHLITPYSSTRPLSYLVLSLIVGFISFFLFIMSIFILIRRLHDINFSGWWCLLGLIFPIGNFILLIMLLIPGTNGANRFGPPPAVPTL